MIYTVFKYIWKNIKRLIHYMFRGHASKQCLNWGGRVGGWSTSSFKRSLLIVFRRQERRGSPQVNKTCFTLLHPSFNCFPIQALSIWNVFLIF